MRPEPSTRPAAAGIMMIEVMVALVLIAIGVLALARLMPTSTRVQSMNRLQETAVQYADEEFESLHGLIRASAALSTGRHPEAGYEALGATGAWRRYYFVTAMPAPLDSLIKVETTVLWTSVKAESVRMTGYLMP